MKCIDGYVTLGNEREQTLSTAALLRAMDEAGLEQAVIFPGDRERVVANAAGNLRMVHAARHHPDRFIVGFSINPWFGEEAIALARNARDSGARILLVDPAVQGFLLGDPLADPLWHWAQESETPVHVRASPSASACPSQLWFLALKFPKVRWILGGGGTSDYGHDLGSVARSAPENLWFEVSTMRGGPIQKLLEYAGEEKMIFGSAAPEQEMKNEVFRIRQLLPSASHRAVFSATLTNLLQ